MLRLFYVTVVFMMVGCVSSEVTSVKEDSIGEGKFYLGLSQAELEKSIDCGIVKYGKDELWGADGLYHQDWNYADCGISFDMTSGEQNASKVVESITIVSPSKLTTEKGIGIGSTYDEVMTAYKTRWNKGESRDDLFVVDSIFGGILFRMTDGKVEDVFVGAGAE
ncbi:MAG: Unknown protein [uncultured Sulfurovum sp.]|uniref:Lipoprotein n=1 Tax=uncultured Sulfurovum sp. TaxID=269237 RepID=A0A6S6SZG0_9BACT|nr:MAG: Unknown protein [uncultured Sulfurovum sp.]